ncbi:MAG: hypothetical protein AUK47_14515 [Deltaproteobacteria bacterium CG2_30_63_29]|nr:MAG: hypothetical protein AUK47_14515 [Deltaproteobacteria bacterium CG2_30_63_29]
MINLLATKTSSPLAALLLLAALLGCEDSANVWVEDDQTIDSATDESLADLADTQPPLDVAPTCSLSEPEKTCAASCAPHEECGDCGCQLNCGPPHDWGSVHPAEFAQTKVALPLGYTMTQQEAASAATFSKASDGVFGFTILTKAGSLNAEQENSLHLIAVAKAGNLPTVAFSQLFTTPDALWSALESLPDELRASGVRARIFFSYGEGMNPGVPSKDPAALRDEIVSTISGQEVSTGESSLSCERVQASWLAQLRPDGMLSTSAVFTCAANFDADERLRFVFEDLFNNTVAPVLALGSHCEELGPFVFEHGKIDFLWVVDNSSAMASVQTEVAESAAAFYHSLADSGGDIRVAVTTTEAYGLIEGSPLTATLDHDELLDRQSGLRGLGFLSPSTPDSRAFFEQYVTWDQDCEALDANGLPAGPQHANLCGSDSPDGLESGALVLERILADPRESYRLRPDSLHVVVWVSNRESRAVAGLTPTDPGWAPIIEGYVERYDALNARGFAVISEESGVCGVDVNPYWHPSDWSYAEVAYASGGGVGNLCAPFSFTDNRIQNESPPLRAPLTGLPIGPSIQVLFDGEVVERSHTLGWNYDRATDAIVFPGIDLERAHVVVSHSTWK